MCHLNLHRTAALHFGVKQIGEPYFRTMYPCTWGNCTRSRNCGVKHVRVGGTMYEPRGNYVYPCLQVVCEGFVHSYLERRC